MTDSVTKMLAGLDDVRNSTSRMPAKAYARKSYTDAIAKQIGMVPDSDAQLPKGMLARFAGMPMYETELLPQGVLCIFLDKDNKPLGQIVDHTYVPPTNPDTKPESEGG